MSLPSPSGCIASSLVYHIEGPPLCLEDLPPAHSTVKGVAEAAPLLETDWDERLLIHISYSPRRWTCRNCSLTSNITSSSIRPCDFKMGRVLASLQTLRCTYTFDLRLPICCEDVSSARKFADILRQGISSHAKELKDAKAIIDGDLVVKDESCLPDGLHEVKFLLPFMKDSFAEAKKRLLVFLPLVGQYVLLHTQIQESQFHKLWLI